RGVAGDRADALDQRGGRVGVYGDGAAAFIGDGRRDVDDGRRLGLPTLGRDHADDGRVTGRPVDAADPLAPLALARGLGQRHAEAVEKAAPALLRHAAVGAGRLHAL